MPFINFSNHPSILWNSKQRSAAEEYGDIIDLPFPSVSATASEKQIAEMADIWVDKIMELHPTAVLCQGEFTLSFAVIDRLLHLNILVLSACSDRHSKETILDGGTTKKNVEFDFVKFRRFER